MEGKLSCLVRTHRAHFLREGYLTFYLVDRLKTSFFPLCLACARDSDSSYLVFGFEFHSYIRTEYYRSWSLRRRHPHLFPKQEKRGANQDNFPRTELKSFVLARMEMRTVATTTLKTVVLKRSSRILAMGMGMGIVMESG